MSISPQIVPHTSPLPAGIPLALGDLTAREALPASARHIALFRALHVGDLLLAVPGMRAIRAGFPHAEITFIGLKWAEVFVARFRHYLDRFVEFVGYPGLGEVPLIPDRTERFLAEQRTYGYDLVVAMHGNGRASLPFCRALGARAVVSYYDGTDGSSPPDCLLLGAPYPTDQPEVLRHVGLAKLLGCPPAVTGDLSLEFPLYEADRAAARELLPGLGDPGALWIALHAGSRAPSHRWPAASFAAVADYLALRHDARIVLLGGQDEVALAQEVAVRMRASAHCLAGRTSLGTLAAIIAGSRLYIGNDTGPAHLAAAVDTPSVTIFGPADHHRWAPLDRARHPIAVHPVACSPCQHWVCPTDHSCLRAISTEAIIARAESLLARYPQAR